MTHVNRRQFLKAVAGTAGVVGLTGFPGVARAQRGKSIVVVSFGGSFQDAERKAYYQPFEAATGIKVLEDTIAAPAKIKAMVDSKNVIWDVCELATASAMTLQSEGYLEEIDYGIVGKDDLFEAAILPAATACFFWSVVLAWNTKHYQRQGKYPKSWADFWDVKNFPGRRSMDAGNRGPTSLELALMADGVPREKMYPLDVDRAWRSLDRVKPHVVKWYTSFAQAMQLLIDGEAVMGTAPANRVIPVMRQGGPVDFVWNQGMLDSTVWAVPKGSRNRREAMEFINFATRPKPQAEMMKQQPGGPVNRKAFDHLTEAEAAQLATYRPNMEVQLVLNSRWWQDKGRSGKPHYQEYLDRFATWVIKS